MSRSRPTTPQVALAVSAAATAWVSLLSWRGFSEASARYLVPLFGVAVLVAATGLVLRSLSLPRLAVVAGQLLVVTVYCSLTLTGSLLPVGAGYQELLDQVSTAVRTARSYAAPVPRSAEGLTALLLPLGALCVLATDVLACTLRRVSAAGLPLAVAYATPLALTIAGGSWWVFAATAAGYLTVVFWHTQDQVSRWGRTLEGARLGDVTASSAASTGAGPSALGIGSAATALAVLLPVLVPTLELDVLGGAGTGGDGNGSVRIVNPMADLRRDLQRGDDVPLLRITTDDPHPAYLRVAALTLFTDDEWRAGDRSIPSSQRAAGQPLTLIGVDSTVPRQESEYVVTATSDFDSQWLPTTTQVDRVQADGDWRYDLDTMDFLSAADDLSTAGETWSMTGVRLKLTAAELADAPSAGQDLDRFTKVPADMPAKVKDLAVEITAGQQSEYERAVALQRWFRVGGGFHYSLDSHEGNGSDALVEFLDSRVGYCEQFASAMAVMARSLGIPARVAVGFLSPDKVGDETWEYSAWDLHAWPELFFQGAGWVRFEPTPAARAASVPGYTRQSVPQDPVLPNATASASNELPQRATSSAAPAQAKDAAATAAAGEGGIGWKLPVGLLTAVALLVMALLPRLVRQSRRERRWRAGDAEAAWAELRDTAVDLGVAWPAGRSPRRIAASIATGFGRAPDRATPDRPAHGPEHSAEAMAALQRVVGAVEWSRYSPEGAAGPVELRSDVETCASALAGGASRRTRRRAVWLPRSVLSTRARRPGPHSNSTDLAAWGPEWAAAGDRIR